MLKRAYIAADHAGYAMKKSLIETAPKQVEFVDLGTNSEESCDYPVYAEKVAKKIQEDPQSIGILICGTGIGMAIAANKFKGIRAAVASDVFSARMAREHNDAQVLCLASRIIDTAKAKECFEAFFEAKFKSDHPRHKRRIDQIERIDQSGSC